MTMYKQNWLQKDQRFSRYGRNGHVHFDCISPHYDLDRGDSQSIFSHDTLWPMMLHHHTKFGCKRFRSSEDITRTNTETFNLSCDPDHQHCNPIFSQNTPAFDYNYTIKLSVVEEKKSVVQKKQ